MQRLGFRDACDVIEIGVMVMTSMFHIFVLVNFMFLLFCLFLYFSCVPSLTCEMVKNFFLSYSVVMMRKTKTELQCLLQFPYVDMNQNLKFCNIVSKFDMDLC